MTTDVLAVICAVVVVGGVWAFVIGRYWLVWEWWPLVGPDWRAERATPRPAPHQPGSPMYPPGSPFYDPDEEFCEDCHTLCTEDRPCVCCYVDNQEREDTDWADQLHAINTELHGYGPGVVVDLATRRHLYDLPIAELTHYEVEAVIAELGVADWLPVAA